MKLDYLNSIPYEKKFGEKKTREIKNQKLSAIKKKNSVKLINFI